MAADGGLTAVSPRCHSVELQHRAARLCARSIRISHWLKNRQLDPTGGNTKITNHLRRRHDCPGAEARRVTMCAKIEATRLANANVPQGSPERPLQADSDQLSLRGKMMHVARRLTDFFDTDRPMGKRIRGNFAVVL